MQCMVIKYYLEEESIGNASGFSADYIRVMFARTKCHYSHVVISRVVTHLSFKLARGSKCHGERIDQGHPFHPPLTR